MRRMIILFWFVSALAQISANGQSAYEVQAISDLLGCDIEETDSEDVERLYRLLKRQLQLNSAQLSELIATGFISRYQAASLTDYRNRNGYIMSYMELSSVNGFSETFVRKIQPFITLEVPSVIREGGTYNEILIRSAVKFNEREWEYSYDARYGIEAHNTLKAAIGLSRSTDAASLKPDILSGHLEWRCSDFPLKLILGDFNARFGQGSAIWNGLDMNSYNTPSSYMRRPSGITSSNSLTGKYANTGIASELSIGNWIVSALFACPGIKQSGKYPEKVRLMPGTNLTYLWSNGQAGLTHNLVFSGLTEQIHIPSMNTSADIMLCIKGIDIFSEVAYDWIPRNISVTGGTVFPIGDSNDGAVRFKLNKNEYILNCSSSSVAGKWIRMRGNKGSKRRIEGSLSTEVTYYPIPKDDSQSHSIQFKFHTQWEYAFTESLLMTVRLTERIRSWGMRFRTDIRSDLRYVSEHLSAAWRVNMLNCKGTAFLTYIDEGLIINKASMHLRQGLFFIDNWDDRIYAYEYDIPGSFNSPAYYGRGLWLSLMATFRLTYDWKLYIRTGYTSYPFMKEKKPGKAELKLQTIYTF